MAPSLVVGPLTSAHAVERFACGKPGLDEWLHRFAFSTQQAGGTRVYVATRSRRVVGYYALAAASVEPEGAPPRISKGLARHPIPVILLARLAVDVDEQGSGLGGALLKNALERSAAAAQQIGARAILVHAKDDDARAFYERFDFDPSPTDLHHLFLLMKDVRRALRD